MEFDKGLVGVNVAVFPLTLIVPVKLVPPWLSVKVEAVNVFRSMASVKVAETTERVPIKVALFEGLVKVTAGEVECD